MTSRTRLLFFKWVTPLVTLLLLALLMEIVLAGVGEETLHTRARIYSTTPATWWVCDAEGGPRFVPQAAGGQDFSEYFRQNDIRWYYDRLQMVNNQGYHDAEDFVPQQADTGIFRVLFVGDSFTWGASAEVGFSFVEVFEKKLQERFPRNQVWNAAIPATGTNHAVFTARKYMPLQHTDLVILGFFVGNDLDDNLLPFDRLVFTENGSCYKRYKLDKYFQPQPQSLQEAYRSATGIAPPEERNALQRILSRTRLYGWVQDRARSAYNKLFAPDWPQAYRRSKFEKTRLYLLDLKKLVEAHQARLLVLVIPDQLDLIEKSSDYLDAVHMIDSLSIPYLEAYEYLTLEDYVFKPNDDHWNSQGHRKIGLVLSDFALKSDLNGKEN